MTMLKTIFIIAITILMISCLSKDERKLVGKYKIRRGYVVNGQPVSGYQHLRLILRMDRSFVVINDSKETIHGEWSVNDYGDFTLLEVYVNNELFGQAQFIGDSLSFDNSRIELFNYSFTKVILKKF